MSDALSHAVLPPLPLRAGSLTLSDLVDLYMAHYEGRDSTRAQRLSWWKVQRGQVALQDLSDDHIHADLEQLATQHSRYFAGNDADGRPIYKAKKRPLAPATLNRYAASLAAVITWAIKRRIAPKGYVHPCRSIERRPENNEKTRFLNDDECKRSGPVRLNSFPRFISGVRAGCRRCRVVHGGGRRLRRTGRRGGQLGAHQRFHLMRPGPVLAGGRSSAHLA